MRTTKPQSHYECDEGRVSSSTFKVPRSKKPAVTRKCQVSNVDETANKHLKMSDNEGAGEINKGEKKPLKGKETI
ncbi:hypothetical protein BYT27DRAFT_7264832 [Phlegmacium glaucopus]|nr:hypothetical protein BYT27DRAFT_7264832 [Phlegmacium glaucopus]